LSYCDKVFEKWSDFMRWPLVASGAIVSPLTKYKSFVDSHISNPTLREFLYGFPGYAGFHPQRAPASLALLPWSILNEGVFYPKGGIAAIPKALYEFCCRKGVEFEFGSTVTSLEVKSKRVVSFSVGNKVRPLANNETMVWNGCATALSDVMGEGAALPKVWKKQSPSFLSLQGSLKQSDVDSFGLKHHNLFLPGHLGSSYQNINEPGAPFPQDPPLYLTLASQSDPSCAPAGSANAFLVVSVPSMLPTEKLTAQKTQEDLAAQRYREALAGYLPGVILEEVHLRGPLVFAESFLQQGGQIYGPSLDDAQILAGFARPVPQVAKLQNLFLVGTSTQPGAGLPMVIQSAKIVANLLGAAN
jgi:phytoene dehydrogenase-like protein